ncbi:pantoate--beta-alanine ligase [Bacillus methanolicus PB1]|uniref:Pantothenate synthetase n=1 Tax=Bacillus methanolicus PB1 TaxID=997296 RepID=I3DWN3_BACMT|nr:pantoate--beta-alanine ligase [Bacillus methanolicus]EIJ78654.1 pantoate--beta-alanine ligase [Bacillus methanolicus PB1]
MKVITRIAEMQKQIIQERNNQKSIGFVPTMGYLHEGHMSLLKRARQENDIVVLSVFVNPLQFGPSEDLDAYPRDFEHDKKVAEDCEVDYFFYPDEDEMFPSTPSVKVIVQDRTEVLCGRSRPGHFDGVATVLTKLFNIVFPDRAYFGMKDAQQVAVVEGLIHNFHFPIKLVAAETVREADGLAKSSRNVNLLPEERKQAPALYESLKLAEHMINEGVRNPERIISSMAQHISRQTSGIIDYIEIYSYPDLKPLTQIQGKIIIALAVKFSRARLIDNIIVTVNE